MARFPQLMYLQLFLRFGHTLIQGMIQMHTVPSGNLHSTFELRDAFFNMSTYFMDSGRGMERILFGLLHQDSQSYDQFVTEDVTNFLRANDSLPRDDLLTRNIHRAREHGLPGYNNFRGMFCTMPVSCNWADPPEGISAAKWSELQMLYDHPGDIDLFTGTEKLWVFLFFSMQSYTIANLCLLSNLV